MTKSSRPKLRFVLDRLGGMAVVAGVIALRALWPERGLDAVGPVALRDAVLSIALVLVVLSIANGLGSSVLRALSVHGLTRLEAALFSCALGLGALGLVNLGLGLIGWLHAGMLAGTLLVGCAVFGPSFSDLSGAIRFARGLPASWQASSILARLLVVVSLAVGCLALVNALSPAWDYDGLMYHLVGPKQFLSAGRVFPDQDNWYVNGPFGVEMVFTYGLAFGDDVFPKLLHFSMSIMLVMATYAAGRRWLGESGGWIAAAILMGILTIPIVAAMAYIDMGWSTFEFLALFAALVWLTFHDRRWLILAGMLIGFAMGSKYLGLIGFGILGLLVLLANARLGWRTMIADATTLAIPAVALAAPWYVKNIVWFGNPVYPLYFGGPGWDTERLALFSAYLDSYGVGKSLLKVVLLPWNVYALHGRFSAVMTRIDVPSFLFPLLAVLPFIRKNTTISVLGWIILARCALWALGSQQLRFLMPIYPAMAVGATCAVLWISAKLRPPWSSLLPGLGVGLVFLTLIYQVIFTLQFRPDRPVIGLESRRSFAEGIVTDYRATEVAAARSDAGRALLLGDGRGYYCLPRCIPDPDHFRWAAAINRFSQFVDFERWSHDQGAGQMVISLEIIDFLLQHDPTGAVASAVARIQGWRAEGCLPTEYSDAGAILLSIQCP